MKNTKLSLADFKAKADKAETIEALDAIHGGGLFNCHGRWGGIGKKIRDFAIEVGTQYVIKKIT
jgi:hypothetical protein